MFERRTEEPVSLARVLGAGLALLSLAAGILHLSAASQHREHRLVFAFFIGAAVVQLAWAGLVVQRPTRRLLLAGAVLNAAFVGIWILSRTTGVPLVAGAKTAEELGLKDTVCAIFEVLLVAGVGLLDLLPDAARRARVTAEGATRAVSVVGLAVLLLTVPAAISSHGHDAHDHLHSDAELAASGVDPELLPHTHNPKPAATKPAAGAASSDGHDHDHADDASSAAAAAEANAPSSSSTSGGHTHGATTGDTAAAPAAAHGDDHEHAAGDAPAGDGTPSSSGGGHTHAAASGTCTPTPAQQAAADKLIADTKANLNRWTDQMKAMADGYVPYPPVPAGWAQHYVDFRALDDGRTMDPTRPESLLFAMTDQGYRPISALYILPHANSKIPDTLGCLAHWHNHPELFLSKPGENGSPPMLHVFTVPMLGGPFAHEPDPQTVRSLWQPFRVLINPWYKDGCEGAPWLPGDPYQVVGSCAGWKDGHPGEH